MAVHLTRIYTRTGDAGTTALGDMSRVAKSDVRVGEYEPLRVTEEQVTQLESWCDEFNAPLPKLASFILAGGTPAAAHLHHARTVARRAERSAWALAETAAVNDCALRYLNRLSDLLFHPGAPREHRR